jgi:hypothetical protein
VKFVAGAENIFFSRIQFLIGSNLNQSESVIGQTSATQII